MYRNISILFFGLLVALTFSCKHVQHLAKQENTNYTVEESTHPEKDSAILAIIAPYRETMEATMNEVIGLTDMELKQEQPDGSMNRLIGDILHKIAEETSGESINFAVQNYGGLRISTIPKGDIHLGLLYELMPFENYLIILEISGETVSEFCDLMASNGGWPVSYGLNFAIEDGRAENIKINGQPLDPSATYTIATNDYVADGGDNCTFLMKYEQDNTGVLLRDAFIEYFQREYDSGKTLSDPGGGARIYYIQN